MPRTFVFLVFVLMSPSIVDAFPQEMVSTSAHITLIDDVRIAAVDPGIVKKVAIRPGDFVSEGQLLIHLNDKLYKTELAAAEAETEISRIRASDDINLRFARKSAEVNKVVLERSKNARIAFAKSISKTEIERVALEFEQSKLSGEQAAMERNVERKNLDFKLARERSARIRLEHRRIESPLDGQVVDVFVQAGEWVDSGQTIGRVITLNKLRIRATFSQEMISKIVKSQKAFFVDFDSGIKTDAKIVFVSPEIDASAEIFDVWAEIENPQSKFSPGMQGQLFIDVGGNERTNSK